MLVTGETVCTGAESIWEISVLPSQVCHNPNTAIKKNVFNENIVC